MTLARQLLLIISTLFVLIFVGTLAISINNTRDYLAEQMRSHAQDTATSLGLSLVPPMLRNDVTHMETMVNAIFDPGYYREIIVQRPDGTPIIERVLPIRIKDVPQWFINLITLETPRAESEVMVGWRLGGKVIVSSHPGYAYRELWLVSVQTFWWSLGVLAVAAALLVAGLRYVLAPLRAVERQALAICEREFPVLERIPRTRELRRVVKAMNKMSTKVERMLSDQVDLTEKMRVQANQDPVTGLANRRHFDARLSHLIESSDEFQSGALFLFQLDNLREFNERHGYEAGDALLRESAQLLRGVFGNTGEHVIGRLGGGNFGILVRGLAPEGANELGGELSRRLVGFHARGLVESVNVGHIGIACYDGRGKASELLSLADMSLQTAYRQGPNAWSLHESKTLSRFEMGGAQQWHKIIRKVINDRRIVLFFQPVVVCGGDTIIHYEALARIRSETGDLIPAGVFIPMAERYGITQDLDRLVVSTVLRHLHESKDTEVEYAVNLSAGSVHDKGFGVWLCEELERRPECAHRLVLEAPEYGVMGNPAAGREFVHRLTEVGGRFSLDHFGLGFASFGYLKNLKLDYIKIDGSYIRGIEQNPDNQFFVQALTDIAHGLDIKVIAESVETEAEWSALQELHLDGAQGHFTGKPRAEI